jgi:hypothetical protein
MKAPRETDLTKACLQLLALRGVLCWRQNSGAAVFGQGKARRFVQMTRGVKGISDILGILPPAGRFLAVECKRPGNKPTADQQGFLDAITAAGGAALVVHDVAELAAALERLG